MPVLVLIALIFFSGGCAGTPPAAPEPGRTGPAIEPPREKDWEHRPIAAPWQLWNSASGSPDLTRGEELVAEGKLDAALSVFRGAMQTSSSEARDSAFLRYAGTLLKLGRSKEVLDEMARYFKEQQLGPRTAPPALSLIAAYAYLHRGDPDQALAWLAAVYNRTSGQGIAARRALTEARRLIGSLPAASFAQYNERWSGDAFAGPIFSAERMRRSQGGAPSPGLESHWFTAQFYAPKSAPGGAGVTEIDIYDPRSLEAPSDQAPLLGEQPQDGIAPAAGEPLAVGLLLPFTGQFAEHAVRVKEGIELALEVSGRGGSARIVSGDTRGDPAQAAAEYTRLSQQERVNLIFGPLLVKTSEQVAQQSRTSGVPFISFTKREAFPALSPAAYRLGGTTESQVARLLDYAGQEGLKTFGILYPSSPAGSEALSIFRKAAQERGLRVAGEASWEPGNDQSASAAVARLAANQPAAVFIADNLENSAAVLQQVKTSALSSSLILGPALWDDLATLRGYGQLVEDAVFVSLFNARSERQSVVEFIEKYNARFGRAPDLLAAQAYDAALFALQALNTGAGGQTVSRLLDSASPLEGATGRLSMGPEGEIVRQLPLLRVRQSEIIELPFGAPLR